MSRVNLKSILELGLVVTWERKKLVIHKKTHTLDISEVDGGGKVVTFNLDECKQVGDVEQVQVDPYSEFILVYFSFVIFPHGLISSTIFRLSSAPGLSPRMG